MSVVPMIKLTLLTHLDDVEPVCEALQRLGAVHLEPLEDEPAMTPADDVAEFMTHCEQLKRVHHALVGLSPAPARLQIDNIPVEDVVRIVEEKLAHIDKLNKEQERLNELMERLLPWGDFDPASLARVSKKAKVTFAVIANDEWPLVVNDSMTYAVAYEDEDYKWAVFFDAENLPVSPIQLPDARLHDLHEKRDRIKAHIEDIKAHLSRFTLFAPMLEARLDSFLDRVALYEAVHHGRLRAPIVAMQGYVPKEKTLETEAVLEPFKVVLRLEEPKPEDKVPVLLRNNRFFSGFEVIVKSFSGLHYREKDVTWMVGLLFILFGSLCLLDAGYGFMLFLTGVILGQMGKKEFSSAFTISGFFAVLVGLVNGQVFGMILGKDFYHDYQPLFPLAIDPFSCFVFSLIVGGLAMGFAYAVAIWQRGFKTQATGNLVLVLALGMYLTVTPENLTAIMGDPSEGTLSMIALIRNAGSGILVAAALLLWVLFPERVFGDGAKVANILWTLYSGATGLVQDILSHMRLFGIALSGSILALVINQTGGIFPVPVTVLFAVVGHGLVYALALLSLFVHANRLIFLEVGSKCIDGGQEYYEPLRRGYAS